MNRNLDDSPNVDAAQLRRLCGLLTRYADRDGRCPRFILRHVYAASWQGDNRIFKARPHSDGGSGSWGRRSSEKLSRHLLALEQAGVIRRDGAGIVTVIDWVALLAVIQAGQRCRD